MKIIESFIKGKIDENLCEDALYIGEDFVGVVDGVSSKSDYQLDGKSTGKLGALMVIEVLKKLEANADVFQFLKAVNKKYNKFYYENEFPYNKLKYGPQSVAAIYSKKRREVWLIGDTQALVKEKYYKNPKASDEIISTVRALIAEIETIECGISKEEYFRFSDPAREAILPLIKKATILANNEGSRYGYAIISGLPIHKKLIEIIKIDDSSQEIVLASDGYPVLENTLEDTEAMLKNILEKDKYCINNYPSTKGLNEGQNSFDDRTYVRIQVEEKNE